MGEFSRARGSPENARAQGAASARLSNGGRSKRGRWSMHSRVLSALLPTSGERCMSVLKMKHRASEHVMTTDVGGLRWFGSVRALHVSGRRKDTVNFQSFTRHKPAHHLKPRSLF